MNEGDWDGWNGGWVIFIILGFSNWFIIGTYFEFIVKIFDSLKSFENIFLVF